MFVSFFMLLVFAFSHGRNKARVHYGVAHSYVLYWRIYLVFKRSFYDMKKFVLRWCLREDVLYKRIV